MRLEGSGGLDPNQALTLSVCLARLVRSKVECPDPLGTSPLSLPVHPAFLVFAGLELLSALHCMVAVEKHLQSLAENCSEEAHIKKARLISPWTGI